jgi:hypothetical protein
MWIGTWMEAGSSFLAHAGGPFDGAGFGEASAAGAAGSAGFGS